MCFLYCYLFSQRSWLLIVIVLIAGGLFMFTYKSTQFNTKGFILVLIASFLGGIRWTLTQILTQKADLGNFDFFLMQRSVYNALFVVETRYYSDHAARCIKLPAMLGKAVIGSIKCGSLIANTVLFEHAVYHMM